MGWKELVVIILVVAIISSVVALTVVGNNDAVKNVLHMVIVILVVILLIYILYEIYEYYQKIKRNEPLLFDGPINGKTSQKFSANMLPRSNVGAEYTYSFWIYVKNWDYKYNNAKHILNRGSDPNSQSYGETFIANPGIWLYPKTSNLMIRFDTYNKDPTYAYLPGQELSGQLPKGGTAVYQDTTLQGCQEKCSNLNTCAGFSVNKNNNQCILKDSSISAGKSSHGCKEHKDCGDPSLICEKGNCRSVYDSYTKSHSMDPNIGNLDESSTNEICDLVELPIQRWVHVGVVLWNRTTDIYLNGKLVRSCILKGVPKVPWKDKLYVSGNDGFDGAMAQLRYFSRALNASEIYKLYSKGPLHWNLLKEFKDLFPKVEISAQVSYGDSNNDVTNQH